MSAAAAGPKPSRALVYIRQRPGRTGAPLAWQLAPGDDRSLQLLPEYRKTDGAFGRFGA